MNTDQNQLSPAAQEKIQLVGQAIGLITFIATVLYVWHWIDTKEPAMRAGLENAHQSIENFQADVDNSCAGSTSAFCEGWNSGRSR
jgi:hypothetical protein